MSAGIRERADDQKIELGTALNWPPILAAASLGLAALTAVSILLLLSGSRTELVKQSELAQRNAVPAREWGAPLPVPPKRRILAGESHQPLAIAEAPVQQPVVNRPKPPEPAVAVKPPTPTAAAIVSAASACCADRSRSGRRGAPCTHLQSTTQLRRGKPRERSCSWMCRNWTLKPRKGRRRACCELRRKPAHRSWN